MTGGSTTSNREAGERATRRRWRRLVPAAVLVAAIALAFALGLDDYLSFEALRDNRAHLLDWVARYGIVAGLAYIAAYIVVVALSLPGATFVSLAGGFLFGAALATVYTVLGATVGATIIFLVARGAVGDFFYKKAGPGLRRMEEGFRENALSYLLVLRLIPLFPFWLVNLVPAFLGVSLRTYVIGTFFGIIPGSFVYCLAGAGLGSVFEAGESFSVANVLTPKLIAALVGLAVLALLPVVYKRVRGRGAT